MDMDCIALDLFCIRLCGCLFLIPHFACVAMAVSVFCDCCCCCGFRCFESRTLVEKKPVNICIILLATVPICGSLGPAFQELIHFYYFGLAFIP
jgi:hypothetical protein